MPYRDPLLDSGLLPVQTGEKKILYVTVRGYPVVKEDEEEPTPYISRPGLEKSSSKPKA